jgi:dihydroxy-acid dehydratase
MTLKVADDIIAARKAKWVKPAPNATKGLLFKYAQSVKDASEGCVTDEA